MDWRCAGYICVYADMGKLMALLIVSALSVFFLLWSTSSVCVSTSLCDALAPDNPSVIVAGRTAQKDSVADVNTAQKAMLANMSTWDNEVTEEIRERVGKTGKIPRNKVEKTNEINRKGNDDAENQQQRNVIDGHSTISNGSTIDHLDIEPTPGDKHIIFIETRCLLDESQNSKYLGLSLHRRQVCAVESAAKMNPDYKVYVLYTCPIYGTLQDSSEYVQTLFTYPNVHLWKLDIERLFSKTPLEKWDFQAAIKSSLWPMEHSSDVLRIVTLWKYGGTYLDLDFVILK